jgi:hypothetical protein
MELHTVFFRGKYRWNETDKFFFALFPLVNPSVIVFFYYEQNKKLLMKDSLTEHFRW